MNELQLIAGCKEHNREAQKILYERYGRLMFGICLRYAPSYEVAQDLLHDGFIKVFSVINSYSGKGSFEGWLKRIFINLVLEYIRKEKNGYIAVEEIQNLPEARQEIDDNRAMGISQEVLIEMIRELPKGYQTVFNLYAIEEYSHKEISEMLEIAEGTSRSQYIRARQLLQEKVKEYLKKNE